MNMKKMFLAIAFLIVAAFNLMAEPQIIVDKYYGSDKYYYRCSIMFKEDFVKKRVQVWKDAEAIVTVFDRKGFGRFHPLGWNSKKPKVFNFQATNLIIKNDLSWT